MNRWNLYYYNMACVVASNSQCYSRKIGAVLVKDKSIIATGYNGPARGIPQCDCRQIRDGKNTYLPREDRICPRRAHNYPSGKGLHMCIAEHAERNCIANAARHGVCTKDSHIYLTCEIPCSNCLTLLINAGITSITVTKLNFYDQNGGYIIKHSNLTVQDYSNHNWLKGEGKIYDTYQEVTNE